MRAAEVFEPARLRQAKAGEGGGVGLSQRAPARRLRLPLRVGRRRQLRVGRAQPRRLLPPQRVQPLPQRRRFAVHPRCRRARAVGLERGARVGVGFPLRRRGGGVGGGGRGGLLRERLLVLRLTKRTNRTQTIN